MVCKDYGFFLVIVYFVCYGCFYFRKRDFSSFKVRLSYIFYGWVIENLYSFVFSYKWYSKE